MDQDERIVDLCQSGRQEGFARLLLAYQDRVYRRAYSFVHNREDALDITQEVFLRTIKGVKQFTPGRPLWPWLRRITTNLALNFLRDRHTGLPLDNETMAAGLDPSDVAEAAWNAQQLHEAMGRLPPLYRMAMVLRHQEDLSYDEVARSMELPLGTVKTYLFRARQMLRMELTRRVEV
ncbi:MAG TPA: sigma-70 family RNA polymerase sigma factor [Symbiobacteriaceae bacterium]|nr:sigma-70 family RNA polymerase sigma factor [Symbiobacteriaceae bacterium]